MTGFSLGIDGIACCKGLTDANGCTARIQSASSGASTITLTAASFSGGYISQFAVGKWIMIGGLDIQGNWASPGGRPTNLQYFERRQITAICNNDVVLCPGTAVLTLDRPLTNTYLSTWPEYNQGNAYEQDPGGPSGIWLLYDGWNATIEYRGLTVAQAGQVYVGIRTGIFRNLTIAGGGGLTPSQNDTFTCITCDYTGLTIEMDKLIGTATFDGLTVSQLKTQSSSVDLMMVKNVTATNNLIGGAKRTEISDATLASWSPGAYAYGASTPSICTRCVVASFSGQASYDQEGGPGNGVFYSMTGGAATTNVTTGACATPQPLAVSTSIFSAGDVGKVIYVPGATSGGAGCDNQRGGRIADLGRWIIARASASSCSAIHLRHLLWQHHYRVDQRTKWGNSARSDGQLCQLSFCADDHGHSRAASELRQAG